MDERAAAAFRSAPEAIVIQVGAGQWRIALPSDAGPAQGIYDGRGPVVITYSFAVGKPYRSEDAARTDASLILARQQRRESHGPG